MNGNPNVSRELQPRLTVLVEVRYDVHDLADLDDFDALATIGPVATQTIRHSLKMQVGEPRTVGRVCDNLVQRVAADAQIPRAQRPGDA